MNAKTVVRDIMAKKGVGTNALADMIGKPARLVSDRLSMDKSDNISVGKLEEMLRVMGYKIVIMPREERMDSEWYKVD